MHVVIVNYHLDPLIDSPQALWKAHFIGVDYARSLVRMGVRVTVCQCFHRDDRCDFQGIDYRLVRDTGGPGIGHRLRLRMNRFISALVESAGSPLGNVIVHVHGCVYPLQTGLLRALLPREIAMVVQHHAESPAKRLRGLIQRLTLRGMDGCLFAARELAHQWRQAGVILDPARVYEVMEASSRLFPLDRDAARRTTGMRGDPLVFWAGNLHPNKDPFIILWAFERLLQSLPTARLYMAFRHESLLDEVRRRIAQSADLSSSVTLLGAVPYEDINVFYNSADLFVQGSHKEGSGIAVLDALACGVLPVVTDIPSFRVITAKGLHGILWPVGEGSALLNGLLRGAEEVSDERRAELSAYFRQRWSIDAIAHCALDVYTRAIAQRRRRLGLPPC